MEFPHPEHFVDRKFPKLLEDSIALMQEAISAHEEKWTPREGLFARASILNSALLLEAAANACIDTLNLTKSFFSDIDKLSVISKFEYFLQIHKPEKILDRGVLQVQQAQELVGMRNLIVHPKPYTTEWKKTDERTYSADLGETQYLKLPKSFVALKHTEALAAVKAVMAFLNYFLKDLCEIPESEVCAFLTSERKYPPPKNQGFGINHTWIGWHDKWGIDVDFLVDVNFVKKKEAEFREHLKKEKAKKYETPNKNT